MYNHLSVGVVIPALNESKHIAWVVKELLCLQHQGHPLIDDLVVCDNASVDNTAEKARQAGARVVLEPRRGFNQASFRALTALKPVDVVLFINADRSDDISLCTTLLKHIETGADLVIGSRFLHQTNVGCRSWHYRFAIKLTTVLISLLWRRKITDIAPFRAIRAPVLRCLRCQQKSASWLLEMQLKALNQQRRIIEIATAVPGQADNDNENAGLHHTIATGFSCLNLLFQLWWRRPRSYIT